MVTEGIMALQTKLEDISDIMSVSIRDPWCIDEKLWLHPIQIDNEVAAGLVTGTSFPLLDLRIDGSEIRVLPPKLIEFQEDFEHEHRTALQEFTSLGIWYNITPSPLSGALSLYLVPVTPACQLDFIAIQYLLENPKGINDWSQITEEHCSQLVVLCRHRLGNNHLLRRIRTDLTPMSAPLPGSREDSAQTYHEYWTEKFSSKKYQAMVPKDGPVLEVTLLPRSNTGIFSLAAGAEYTPTVLSVPDGRLFPQKSSSWLPISPSVRRAYEVLPVLCHQATNIYRALCARHTLQLPLILTELIVESFTIPSAAMPFSNQRLETLGDAVLQLCSTVHLLNQYPSQNEGQLSKLRQKQVNNKFLLRKALDLGLEHFINTEVPSVYKWRYVLPDCDLNKNIRQNIRTVPRQVPRRSLQDCMEALLGASFVAGGIPLALRTGTALGLEFGGSALWFMRYGQTQDMTPFSTLCMSLEESLGYSFRYNHLVLESLTHPSFANSEVPSYQRLEFLGDAIIELVVSKYLFDKFPHATSYQLSLPRARAICSPTLAYLAVERLGLHRMMRIDSVDLSHAISVYVPILEDLTAEEVVKTSWRLDPPKVLSDVFESVVGAVLVDSGYNYEKTASVVEYVMRDVLEALSPTVQLDPVSELTEWMAGSGCRSLLFESQAKETDLHGQAGVAVFVHGNLIVRPVILGSTHLAKFAAAESALAILKDSNSHKSLLCLCNCATTMDVIGCVDCLWRPDLLVFYKRSTHRMCLQELNDKVM